MVPEVVGSSPITRPSFASVGPCPSGKGKPSVTAARRAKGQPEARDRLFSLLQELAEEQHPDRTTIVVSAATSLEDDLALDSMARFELRERIEHAFGVDIGEDGVAEAVTAKDLLTAIRDAPPAVPDSRVVEEEAAALTRARGSQLRVAAGTLLDVVDWHVAEHPDRQHVRYLVGDNEEVTLDYTALRDAAAEVAAGLQERGFVAGEAAAIMLPTSLDYLFAFLGVEMAGGIPVPIYPPARRSQIEDHLRRHAAILDNAGCSTLITVPEAMTAARLLRGHVPSLGAVLTVENLREAAGRSTLPVVRADDLGFLQYTSGSTGTPKGVMLTHANLLANVRAMGERLDLNPESDVVVSWLPLYHDMGLIGAWMSSLYFGIPLVLMSPQRFLSRPERWLWAIHNYGGTISASPNFGYELCRTRVKDEALEGLDLSTWRIAANGAEAVQPATLARFEERFRRCGLSTTTQRPVYGLAENCVGLAFPTTARPPRIDRIARGEFSRSGRAVVADPNDETALAFPACGEPLPGHEIRVIDSQGREVPERHEGGIEFRGPSSTQGYYRNPEATAALYNDGWLRTGDRGYLAEGEIHVTGREKDSIVQAGRNLYAAEIETAVGAVEGVRTGCVAVFGARGSGRGTERLVVLAETRETESGAREEIVQQIRRAVVDLLGEPADDVALAPPFTVLKTSSGKIRRTAVRDLYERGEHSGRRAPWLQLVRLTVSAVGPSTSRMARRAGTTAYAAWWWTCAGVVALVSWPVVCLIPSSRFARAWIRVVGRAFFRAIRAHTVVAGAERLPPDGPLVVAANHTSLLDPLLLLIGLPRPVRFVAKNTLERSFWSRMFLRRLGTLFVERFDAREGAANAAPIQAALEAGEAVVFFPEGTFRRMPGLLPFRMGAFVVAAETGAPVVPVAVRGLRTMLRGDSWFPRAAQAALRVGAPATPDAQSWKAAVRLRDATRAELLRHTGEPDLRRETGQVERLRPEARKT